MSIQRKIIMPLATTITVGSNTVKHVVHKMFVANLPWTVGSKELKMYFSKFGYVSNASVIYDKTTAMSRGFGFVSYANRSCFIAAESHKNHLLEGRILTVQPATQ